MGRAVCRKCWTWHGSGATVCPRCGAPLAAGNAPAPPDQVTAPNGPIAAAAVQPVATTPAVVAGPAISSVPRKTRLVAIAAAAVVLAAIAVLLLLQWSARAESTDGAFSVQLPSGWERFTGSSLPDGTTTKDDLLVVLGPIAGGIRTHVFIYKNQADVANLGQLPRTWRADQATCHVAGAVSHFSPLTPATVAGSAALVTECRTPTVTVEFITVNNGNHTYTIGFSAASSQFDQQRDGPLHDLLASWRWN